MGEIPEDVSGAANSRGTKLGAASGVAAGALALAVALGGAVITILSTQVPAASALSCCCGFPLITEVVGIALVVGAAGFTAWSADWSRVPGDDALMFGAKLGLRVGAIAGILGGVLVLLSKLLGTVLSPAIVALYYGTDIVSAIGLVVAGLVWTVITGVIIGVLFAVASVLFAAGTGAAVGMMKKQA